MPRAAHIAALRSLIADVRTWHAEGSITSAELADLINTFTRRIAAA